MARLQLLPKAEIIRTASQARRLIPRLYAQPWVAVDTETTSKVMIEARLVCWAVAWRRKPSARIWIPYRGHRDLTHKILRPWLEDPKARKSFTHAKYDTGVFANHGIRVRGLLYDTLILDWLADENREGRHGLKECALDHLGLHMSTFKDLLAKYKAKTFADIPEDVQIEYSSKDPWVTASLLTEPSMVWQKPVLEVLRDHKAPIPGHPKRTLLDHYHEVEIPFIEALGLMELRGIQIDRGYLKDMDPDMRHRLQSLAAEFNTLSRRPVNLNSPQDLGTLFYREMGMTPTKWTKGGQSGIRRPSVDQSVIAIEAAAEKKQNKRGLFTALAEYRKLKKLHSTYVVGLLKASELSDRRIHSSFRMDLVTGRLSSSKPNLQNIPRTDNDSYGIRASVIPKLSDIAGKNRRLLICMDYSQLEIRVAAHFSGDTGLIDAIISGRDIHAWTAAEMYGLDYDAIMSAKKNKGHLTPAEEKLLKARGDAKVVNFGLYYGMQSFRLSNELSCSQEDAQDKINRYFATYPGMARWLDDTKEFCRRRGFVQTLQGRYRRLKDICKGLELIDGEWITDGDRRSSMDRRHAENQAVNTPIQGGAADIVKMAMIKTSELEGYGDPQLKRLDVQLVLQIHDEILWECPEENVDKAISIIRPIMEHPLGFDLKVPLTVDGGAAECWSEAKG